MTGPGPNSPLPTDPDPLDAGASPSGQDPLHPSDPNRSGRAYWDRAWDPAGIEHYPIHTELIEQAKWAHLRRDLRRVFVDRLLEGAARGGANDQDGPSGVDGAGVAGGPAAGLVSLEVGSGAGILSARLAEAGCTALLLDYSRPAVATARASFTRLAGRERKRYLLGDAFHLPLRDASVDLVVSGGVLEHFPDPDAPVREMVRVLKPGGLFYADIVPEKFSLVRLAERMQKPQEDWFEIKMGKREVRALAERNGLRVVRVFSAGVLPPRGLPGTGRFRWLSGLQRGFLRTTWPLWRALDGSRLADGLGLYFYLTAVKPGSSTYSTRSA